MCCTHRRLLFFFSHDQYVLSKISAGKGRQEPRIHAVNVRVVLVSKRQYESHDMALVSHQAVTACFYMHHIL
jgi:hypothetical protein